MSTSAARAQSAPAQKTALLIGNPLFDLSAEQQVAAERKLATDVANGVLMAPAAAQPSHSLDSDSAHLLASGRSRDMAAGQKLPPLPGTGAEVAAIAALMESAGWKTELFTEQMALKRVVAEARSPRVVHLATHGFFLPDQQVEAGQQPGLTPSGPQAGAGSNADGNAASGAGPRASAAFSASGFEDPMLRSGLYFAGANRTLAGEASPQGAATGTGKGGTNGVATAADDVAGNAVDNGVLTALEAGNLDLTGTELVVLSACNTGQGEVKNGEGVFGLRRALEEAGAQSVMMSLWSVPDKETLELMKLFYAKWLAGTEKHEALKQAQLEMRQRVRSEHDGHDLPYYWAAFVLVGK
jgi:CHAT domain-containing protein